MDGGDEPGRKLSNSQRALGIKDVPRDGYDLDRLREEWRIAANEWAAARDNADRLEEGRPMIKDELVLAFIAAGESMAKAEKLARVSQEYKDYVKKLFDAKRLANDLYNEMRDRDHKLKTQREKEWNSRAEMFLSRG